MAETLLLLLALAGGLMLGVFFYGGLLWTVQRGLGSPRPALRFLASYLLRTGIAMAGFYALSDRWPKLLMCLLGFLAARSLVMRLYKTAAPGSPVVRECGHAA